MLHGAFGDIPLWLDEGLAEYFETDLSLPDAERARLDLIAADLRTGWSPNLPRLEAMKSETRAGSEILAASATSRKRSGWRASTSRVLSPTEPVEPSTATPITG